MNQKKVCTNTPRLFATPLGPFYARPYARPATTPNNDAAPCRSSRAAAPLNAKGGVDLGLGGADVLVAVTVAVVLVVSFFTP
jgi:hypothetical protein